MKRLKFVLIALLLMLLSSCGILIDDSPIRMSQMRQDIPEMIEIFEQSKEYLEILRNGQLANLGRSASANSGLFISYGGGGVPYERWDSIEWLSYEEREAILFLLRSEELSRNFTGVGSPTGNGVLVAGLYRGGSGSRTEHIEIRYGGEPDMAFMRDSHTVDLGDGYTLWVYTRR